MGKRKANNSPPSVYHQL